MRKTDPFVAVAITGAMEVSARLFPAGAFAAQLPTDGMAKLVIASLRKKPSTVSHAPKLTLIVVVMASAFPQASTTASWLVDGSGACSTRAHSGRETPVGSAMTDLLCMRAARACK